MTLTKNWAVGRRLFKLVLDIGHKTLFRCRRKGTCLLYYFSYMGYLLDRTKNSSYHRRTIEKPLVNATSATVVSIITERQVAPGALHPLQL